MTSASKRQPINPEQASQVRGRIDRQLDPEFFKTLGEPTRARLLACLIKCGRPCSVTEIAACCSIDFSVVARHLVVLARSGVLTSRKQGRTVWYEAPAADLSARFRALADAIDEWDTARNCCSGQCEPTEGRGHDES